MKVLILNSGVGKRMGKLTSEHPKCMTVISESGETILSRQLKMFNKYGIKKVVLTTGIYHQLIKDYCKSLNLPLSISYCKNPLCEETNYIYSIFLAKDLLIDDILLLHGDLVFEESVLQEVFESRFNCMTTSSIKELPEKDFKAVVQNDRKILKVGIEFFDSAIQAQPLYKIDKINWIKWLNKIEEFCNTNRTSCYAEDALNELNGECNIYALDIRTKICEEIDNIDDYIRVCNMLGEGEWIDKYLEEVLVD